MILTIRIENMKYGAYNSLNNAQSAYDNMLPPDNSFMEDAVEEQVAIIIDRQGLDWL